MEEAKYGFCCSFFFCSSSFTIRLLISTSAKAFTSPVTGSFSLSEASDALNVSKSSTHGSDVTTSFSYMSKFRSGALTSVSLFIFLA